MAERWRWEESIGVRYGYGPDGTKAVVIQPTMTSSWWTIDSELGGSQTSVRIFRTVGDAIAAVEREADWYAPVVQKNRAKMVVRGRRPNHGWTVLETTTTEDAERAVAYWVKGHKTGWSPHTDVHAALQTVTTTITYERIP